MIASAMPEIVPIPGRSPSAIDTATGTITAHTAVIGATIAIDPIASAR